VGAGALDILLDVLRIHAGNVSVVEFSLEAIGGLSHAHQRVGGALRAGGRLPRALVVAMGAWPEYIAVQSHALVTLINIVGVDTSLECVAGLPRALVAQIRLALHHCERAPLGAELRVDISMLAMACPVLEQIVDGSHDMARECEECGAAEAMMTAARGHGRGSGRVAAGFAFFFTNVLRVKPAVGGWFLGHGGLELVSAFLEAHVDDAQATRALRTLGSCFIPV
jgi:hypothetical protein